MAYFNLMILLSRYIFAGFGCLFIIVAFSFMKPFISYSLGRTDEKNKFLYLCIVFFHLGGVSIVAGKQTDLTVRMSIIINGLIIFSLITLTLWLLKLWKRHQEIILWNMIFFLMDIGYIMLERLDHALASKQVIACVVGVGVALIFPSIFAILIRPRNKYLYLCILLVMMLLPFIFGSKVLGATNWIEINGMSIQPSEIGKVALVLFLAALFNNFDAIKNKKRTIISAVTVLMTVLGCLVLQRDLGASLLYYLTFLIMLLMAAKSFILLGVGIIMGGVGATTGYLLFSHVRVRVQAFIDPWQDITGTGYQVVQGLFAIGTWGWFGSGLTRGIPNKIPFSANDYIFAALCEEFGNLIGIIILLCYLGIILQCINVALRQKNEFYMLITIGIATLFAVQTFIIVGGVLKLIPLTGITSPFLSAGGSSMVVSMGMIGLITYFSYDNKAQEVKEED
ncbi:FtsW/RodA/SpoVE family cell cycle protein [Cellulosilyticum sp. I15G10I2]|uniref:FtsW/RodA/SpoVE family cell cycle protein n=1 Tax=Cellulosilyticum sp. I15G10I2 TaxID=1892843 RepID=UPI00085C1AF1|nr:FtsW/RodA/SpoVE family cell cycle protein [Cellulosilyticum sp. I15G10I2]